MAKRKTKLATKMKKKWFMVLAPEIYKNTEIAEITAFEPQNLVGRSVQVSLMKITGIPKDQHKKVVFKIKDTQGEKALTEPWKLLLQEGFIQRASRRFKERILTILKIKAKDGKTVKLKLVTLVVSKLPRAVKTDLAKKIEASTREKVSKLPSSDLFAPMALDKLSMELKKEIKTIYPVNRIVVWKLTVI